MAQKKSEFISAFDIAARIWKSLVNAILDRGGTDDDLRRIETDETLRGKLAEFIVGAAKLLYPFTYRFPWWNDKCRVIREGAPCTAPIPISKLKLVSFHKKGEDWVSFDEMLSRANNPEEFPGCQGWGMHQGEQLLKRANELPEEMRKYFLLLPDTLLLGGDGYRCIACLIWDDGEWRFYWRWNDYRFDRYCRFLRLSK